MSVGSNHATIIHPFYKRNRGTRNNRTGVTNSCAIALIKE
nr:MAG TPA: ATPase expression protein 1 [Caudoviricetes sp.]